MTATAVPPQLAELTTALATHRLVNVFGPLGVGKTHLVESLSTTTRVEALATVDGPGMLADPAAGHGAGEHRPAESAVAGGTAARPGVRPETARSAAPPRGTRRRGGERADRPSPAAGGGVADVHRGTVGAVIASEACTGGAVLVVDEADAPGRLGTVRAVVDHYPGSVVVVTRKPLASYPVWSGLDMATIRVVPLPDARIDEAARDAGIADPAVLAWVTRIAGGIPLVVHAAVRALRAGVPPTVPGALADRIAQELLERLSRESPGRRWQHALRLLATAGSADEAGLAGGPELFTLVSGLSVVVPGPLGLSIAEPYREILELAYAWRQPDGHRKVRDRTATRALARLSGEADAERRAALAEQALFLTAPAPVRATLFPPAPGNRPVHQATAADADDIARLMRRWSHRNGFAPERAERVVASWSATDISSFHLVRDEDDRLLGLANLMPIADHTADSIEPLLQQHSDAIIGDRRGALLLGAAFGTDRAAHARILRHTLAVGTRAGDLVVSTANPDYLHLLRALRFDPHGPLREDLYRSGRAPEVYSNDFTAGAGRHWLQRFSGSPGAPTPEVVAAALHSIDDLAVLSASPLLTSPATPTAQALRRWLHTAIAELAAAADPVTAEAGTILAAYYPRPSATHIQVASRLHLSRATYFRRLRHGLELIAARHLRDATDANR
ncbi:hypothetical protein [Nocardia sp. CC227C]|uniref:hypothetical protein n=1 Tax=Nocardia sp. CC227C TaxID=3044562 RepID=UPI00278C3A0E|nr:hypothetical protein [Nocardia sp. CC227C]